MIAPLADNIVAKQLGRIVADAESLLAVAAWADLPAGLRIIDCAGGRLAGGCLGSGHRLARAHSFRPGAVAVMVAAEYRLRFMLELWDDNLPAALGEAALAIEAVAAHELAHALVADPDDPELQPGEAEALRRLPAAVAAPRATPAERTARDHDAAWAAGLVILAERCRRHRGWARHRWPVVIADDLRSVGIDHEAVAEALGHVGHELPLRCLLAAIAALIVGYVCRSMPCVMKPAACRASQATVAGLRAVGMWCSSVR